MTRELWVEKYRPRTIEDCILPERLKSFFQSMIDKDDLQNLLLIGGAGVGKTTAARAMCSEMGIDVLFINASEKGNIDTLRTEIRSFASTISFIDGKLKCVILDEADYLNPSSTQPALRSFIEEFANNCRFILTANFANRILDPIKSRCTVVDFGLRGDEKRECVLGFNNRIKNILENEGIKFNIKELAQVIMKYFPDYRKILNECQRNSHSGVLDAAVLAAASEQTIEEIMGILKSKKFNDLRKWVVRNIDIDFALLVRGIYTHMVDYVAPKDIPELVLLLNEYDYRRAFVMDPEIHIVAMLTQIMGSVEFK